MAIFKPNEKVVTDGFIVDVESPEDDPLLPGTYVFQLVVLDDENNESQPVHAKVVITDTGPRAVIRAEADQIPFGKSFQLSGEGSSDIPPGKITQYIWTLVEQG